jgi:hypothetical protein
MRSLETVVLFLIMLLVSPLAFSTGSSPAVFSGGTGVELHELCAHILKIHGWGDDIGIQLPPRVYSER